MEGELRERAGEGWRTLMMSLPLTLSADGSRCPRRILLFLTSLALSFRNGRIDSAFRRPHRFVEGNIDGRALKIDGKRQVTPTMLHCRTIKLCASSLRQAVN